MHTLLLLLALLPAVLGGVSGGAAGIAPRRRVLLPALGAPAASLALALGGVAHFAGRACLRAAPAWDRALAGALVLAITAIALGGLGLGLIRLALLSRVVARRSSPAGSALATDVVHLAARLGVAPPRLRLCALDRPLALTCGLCRPTILLSTWMVAQLDRRELAAVLAHELAHIARRDALATWLATTLRDAFCYLPGGWLIHRRLREEAELACDDLTVMATARPLALASALAKVWRELASGSGLAAAPALVRADEVIERRIDRLLASPPGGGDERAAGSAEAARAAMPGGLAAVTGLVACALAGVALLAAMGCGPAALLGRPL